DGTWNKLNPDLATNVVLTAASIQRTDDDGIAQIIHYDEGVGTDELEKVRGGVFGQGLVKNLREAYRFLIFNYDPGDEIY
ncbi:phospholipase effector Tle1 domain-containing protein, partial [Salmonella enterica]|uniref:phospholipase effector Tle1 domain-containing protein n=1 Tax=Salmonella enterica TaxID=28901 RepID=UPI0020C1E000